MTASTTERKPSTPAPCTCARCGRKLTQPIHTAIGTVGPECIKHVETAQETLRATGLAALADRGEIRVQTVRHMDGTYHSAEATHHLTVLADRAGLRLAPHFDPATREIVLTASKASLRSLLNRTKGVQA